MHCSLILLEARHLTRSQQQRLAEALPPFPSLKDHPDQQPALFALELLAKRFDDPVAKGRMLSALAEAKKGDPGNQAFRLSASKP